VIEKRLLKFEAEGREFSKFLLSQKKVVPGSFSHLINQEKLENSIAKFKFNMSIEVSL
jgi:hypothetical protein